MKRTLPFGIASLVLAGVSLFGQAPPSFQVDPLWPKPLPNIDTFDMKPDAPAEIRGPFKPISTASPEIQISEILPLHAKIADKFSLVRSCHHGGAAVHDAGWQVMQTGRVFYRRREYAARGVGRQLSAGRKTTCRRSSCCRRRWAAAAATCPTARPADFWARRTIRFR